MRALFYSDFEAEPHVRSVPAPTPSGRGVVVRVCASGLCRSDWHGWKGHDPVIDFPHVPGHELAGVVSAVGADVERWTPGDRVTVPFVGGCGQCEHCAAGHPQVCPDQFQPGFTAWGAFAEQVAIDYADANLVGLPDDIDFVTAASLGCRFGTAFRAVVDQGEVTAGDWVVVHGCGGVGASAVMIAAAIGARPIAVDIREEALALAREVGAAWTLHAEEKGAVAERIRQKTSGGAHVSLDALGSAETCANSVSCLRPRGRHVQVGLMVGGDREANLPLDRVVADELELRGTHGVQAHRYPALLELVRSETLAPQQLVRRTLTLDQAGAALMRLGSEPGPGIQVIDTFD